MLDVTLRPALAADHSLIRKLILQNNLNPLGLEWESFTVAADEQNQLVGCGQIKRHGEVEELASLVVVDEWQGRGISKLLMDALIERGMRPLWLMCESPLTNFYKKFGFEEVKNPTNLPGYFRNMYWFTRLPLGMIFLMRGTYVAFMVLDDQNQ